MILGFSYLYMQLHAILTWNIHVALYVYIYIYIYIFILELEF